jgi:hypothetical protein
MHSITEIYDLLKFCPECGKELEQNPIEGSKACFLHGDLLLRKDQLIWQPMKTFMRY